MKQFTALIFTALLASVACAADQPSDQSSNPGHNRLGACKADLDKLCPNAKPGGGRIAACLKDNQDKLSDGCKAMLAKRRAKKSDDADSDK